MPTAEAIVSQWSGYQLASFFSDEMDLALLNFLKNFGLASMADNEAMRKILRA